MVISMVPIHNDARNDGVEENLEKLETLARDCIACINNTYSSIDVDDDDEQWKNVATRIVSSTSTIIVTFLTALVHYDRTSDGPLSPDKKKLLLDLNLEVFQHMVQEGLIQDNPDVDFGVAQKSIGPDT